MPTLLESSRVGKYVKFSGTEIRLEIDGLRPLILVVEAVLEAEAAAASAELSGVLDLGLELFDPDPVVPQNWCCRALCSMCTSCNSVYP